MTSLKIGDRPYYIEKCQHCNKWHIYGVQFDIINQEYIIGKLFSTINFSDILIIINSSLENLENFLDYGADNKFSMQRTLEMFIRMVSSVK